MKNLLRSLFLISISFLPYAQPATTGEFFQIKKDLAAEQSDLENKACNGSSVSNAFAELTRALSSDPVGLSKDAKGADVLAKDQVQFTKSAYGQGNSGNVLYLGAEELGTDKKNFSFARAVLGTNSKSESAPVIQSLAPDKVTLNGEADQDNPLVAEKTQITNLTLLNKAIPVLTASSKDVQATKVIMVSDTTHGSTLFENADPIKDAGDAEIDKGIVGLAASGAEIFAAVPAMGKNFDDADVNDRGIALLRKGDKDLTVIDMATKLDTMAYNLTDMAKNVQLAFYSQEDAVGDKAITKAKIGEKAAMFWDDKLQRLFIGLEARRDPDTEINKAGGVLNLAVARLEKKATTPEPTTADLVKISPIVQAPDKVLFYDATTPDTINIVDRMIGFYFDSGSEPPASKISYDTDVFLATDMIKTLHTTTGRDYLITVGRFSDGEQMKREVYALPLQGTSADPDGTHPERIGTLSKSDFSGAPTQLAQMPQRGQAAVLVGGATGSFDETVNVTDLFVIGDSVYICLAGRPGMGVEGSNEVGIFQSTALFDTTGVITGWTPFIRVMGSLERVFGAGLDNRTGQYLFLTETNDTTTNKPFFDPTMPNVFANNISTVRLSSWGKTDSVNNLGIILENLFSLDRGGVHQLREFNEKTPGFRMGEFLSVMVATGLGRVALIQSGKSVGGASLFVPETKFSTNDPNKNVFVFNDQALQALGPICTADFARSAEENEGWLFVGGYNGVAVLRQVNGNGFDSDAGLEALTSDGFPGNGYSFLKLQPSFAESHFDHVRKVACLNRVLYVLTEDNLYAIDIAGAAGKFRDAGADDLEEEIINLNSLPSDAALLDFIPLAGSALEGSADFNSFRALLATTKGLFVITRDAGNNHRVTQVLVNNASLGPVIQLQYLSRDKGSPSALGNLYLLTANIASSPSQGKVYRFNVDATLRDVFVAPIAPNNGLVADLGNFRGNFFADGSTILHTRGKHFDDRNYMNAQPTTDPALVIPLTTQLALSELNTTIGAIVRESASGALYAPGDWGVRANL